MENLEFVLGVLSTVGVFLVGYASIGVFKVKTKVRDVNQSIDNAYLAIDELGKDFNNNIKDLQLDYQNQFDDVYRLIDSRFDKFENKINKK
jgi:ribosome-associated translation inhibitor RaiA|tara:strand:+ start:130 stop:402 length:273 start_codon:yes stop_codon:yes gene_type:complete